MATIIAQKFEVLGELGRGGMAVVYKVRDTRLDTLLAVKVLSQDLMADPELVKRFYREARVMAQLTSPPSGHSNIVKVLDVGHDLDLNAHYFVMEYIQGQTLHEYLQANGSLPLLEVLQISSQVAQALDYAHQYEPPVIHRDIKPSNIMLEDGSSRVVIMDFGIAKELDEREQTQTGVVLGTMKYCPPEQMQHKPLTGATDVYALGMVMYEAYTGEQFFAGLNEHQVIGKVLYEEGENEPVFLRPPPPAFAEVIRKAIAKDREQRYAGMPELLAALRACAVHPKETQAEDNTLVRSQTLPLTPESTDDIETIEEQIRRLEVERERRLTLSHQAQVKEAREQAAQAGAQRWAEELFQQGLEHEERGLGYSSKQAYTLADAAYQEALALFQTATEEAKAIALFQRTEHLREETAAAKAEAERHHARERARTLYGRALALQVEADDLWEQQAYQQAQDAYKRAGGLFADAETLAYRAVVKEAAEQVQAEVLTAREQARAERAEAFAQQPFQAAFQHEQRATVALEAEEYTQAHELYQTALQYYRTAHHQAQAEQLRQHALALQGQVARARQAAKTAGARSEARVYQEAVTAQQEGDTQLEAQRYDGAVQAYEQAQRGYEQAQEEAEREQERQAAQAACQRLAAVRLPFLQGDGPQWFPQEVARAEGQVEQAQAAERQDEFTHAGQLYAAATQDFVRIEAAVQERLRQQAIIAQRQAKRSSQEATEAQAQPAYQQARAFLTDGGASLTAQRWTAATHAFTQASECFAEALLRTVEQLQKKTLEARAEAEQHEAATSSQPAYERALAVQQQADEWEEQEAYRKASQGYREAYQLFVEVHEQALREQSKQAAVAAQAETAAARRQAEQAAAKTLVPQAFQAAQQSEQQATVAFAAAEFSQAQALYQAALQQYVHAQQQAGEEQLRQHALSIRTKVAEARQAAEVAGATTASNAYRQASEAHQQGDDWLSAQHYEDATHVYEEACQGYTQASQEALRDQQRRAAATARQEAEAAQVQARQAGVEERSSPVLVQAEQQLAQGVQSERRGAFPEAFAAYEEATQAFQRLQQEAEEQAVCAAAQSARQQLHAVQAQAQTLRGWAAASWAQADQYAQEVEVAWQGQAYRQAHELTKRTLARYRQAAEEAEYEQLVAQVKQAQDTLRASRAEADQARALHYAATLYQQAHALQQQGDQACTADTYAEALEAFTQAQAGFAQAIPAARQAQTREAAKETFQQVQAAREAAVEAGAQERFAEPFSALLELVQQGQTANEQEAFQEAQDAYVQARQGFVQLHRDAEQHAAKEQVTDHQRQVEAIRETVQAFRPWAETHWTDAQSWEEQAAHAYQAQTYAQASEYYTRAWQAYEQVREEGKLERQRQEAQQAQKEAAEQQQQALAAQAEAAHSKQAAIQASAEDSATDLFLTAHEALREATQLFKSRAWTAATTQFGQAQAAFVQAAQQAQRCHQEQAAAAARQEALAAQHEVQAGRGSALFPEQFTQATQVLTQAEQSLQREDFALAQGGFEESTALFQQLCHETVVFATREQAEQAKEEAQELQAATRSFSFWKRRRADKAFRSAKQMFSAGHYAEAQQHYEEATQAFQRLQQEAEEQADRAAAQSARQQLQAVQAQAQTLRGWAAVSWAQADQCAQEVEAAWQGQAYRQARELTERTLARYRQAAEDADHEQLVAQVEQAQDTLRASRAEADQARASHYAATLYQQAHALQQQGDQACTAHTYAEALEAFTQAQAGFAQAIPAARQAQAREAAREAFQQVQAAREAAVEAGAQERFAEPFSALLELVQQGQTANEQEAFQEAQDAYVQARQGFVQLHRDAEQHAAKEQVTDHQRQALAAEAEAAHSGQAVTQANAQDSAKEADCESQNPRSSAKFSVLDPLFSLISRYRIAIVAGAAVVVLIVAFVSKEAPSPSPVLPVPTQKMIIPAPPPSPVLPVPTRKMIIPAPPPSPVLPYVTTQKTIICSDTKWTPIKGLPPLSPDIQVFVLNPAVLDRERREKTKDWLILVSKAGSSEEIGFVRKDHAQLAEPQGNGTGSNADTPAFLPYVTTQKTIICSDTKWTPIKGLPPLSPNIQVFVLNPAMLDRDWREKTKDWLILVLKVGSSEEVGFVRKDHAQPVEPQGNGTGSGDDLLASTKQRQ